MTLTLHLVEHRVRDLPRTWARRDRLVAAIERTPGATVARLGPEIMLHSATGGTPHLRRTALLVGWADPAARDAALADGSWTAGYADDARETWTLALDTVRVLRGDWHGWRPDTGGVPALASDEPMAVMTFGATTTRSLPAFVQGNRRVCRRLGAIPDSTFRVGFIDGPLGFGTFSLWHSQAAMTRFAYREAPHEPVRRRFHEEARLHREFFARFRPVASQGTWRGRDPLADLRADLRPDDRTAARPRQRAG